MSAPAAPGSPVDPNRRPCVFALPLGRRQAVCECARRNANPARTVCADPVARAACAEFDGLLQEKALFVIRQRASGHSRVALHTAALHGLRSVLDPQAPAPNVHALVRAAGSRYGSLAALPWPELIRAMAAWRPGQGIIGR